MRVSLEKKIPAAEPHENPGAPQTCRLEKMAGMKRCASAFSATLVLLSFTSPATGRNYSLHSPKLWSPQEKESIDKKTVTEKEKPASTKKQKHLVKTDQIQVKDGVSFREVTVVAGDTLSSIAVRYHKEGASYSEILRVNKITNPGRIKAGDVVKVVLNRKLQNRPKTAKQGATAALATTAPSPPAATNVAVKKTLPKQLRFINNSTVRMTPVGIASAIPTAPVPDQAVIPAANHCLNGQQPVASASDSGQKMYEQAIKSYRQGDFKTAIRLFGELLAEHPDSSLAADVSLFIADCYLKLSNP
jgi:TolA-binding protein